MAISIITVPIGIRALRVTAVDLVSKKLGIAHIHKSYKEYVENELEVAKFTDNALKFLEEEP